jgi:hypothetical protein
MTAYDPIHHTHSLRDDEPQVPEPLSRALRGAMPPFAAPGLDEAVFVLIEQRGHELRRAARRRRMTLSIGTGLAAAAALALAVFLGLPRGGTPVGGAAPAVAQAPDPDDINGDGKVDILDALALARSLRDQAAPSSDLRLDRTGDGLVDERDVDAIARTAVRLRLPGEGRG